MKTLTFNNRNVVVAVTVTFLMLNLMGWMMVNRKPCVCDTLALACDVRPAPQLNNVEEQDSAMHVLVSMLAASSPVQYKCKHEKVVQNTDQGEDFERKFCEDSKLAMTRPCLVYSFGIDYDFGFDDFFGNRGCEVHSFDPSMTTKTHRRSPQVMFYQMGLGPEDTDTFHPRLNSYVKEKTKWKMRTLKTLVTMLNHTGRTIDLLKMDIECTEWDVVRNMLDSGIMSQVKQFTVEWHIMKDCPSREKFLQLIAVLKDLNRAGFKNFAKLKVVLPKRSWGGRIVNVQTEVAYVNTRFVNP